MRKHTGPTRIQATVLIPEPLFAGITARSDEQGAPVTTIVNAALLQAAIDPDPKWMPLLMQLTKGDLTLDDIRERIDA